MLDLAAVVISLIALFLSIQANAIAAKSNAPQVLELESRRGGYSIEYNVGRGGAYSLATCDVDLRIANVGGVNTEIRDIDVNLSVGKQSIATDGLHDNFGGYDTIGSMEFTTYVASDQQQPMTVPAHSTTTITTTIEVLVPAAIYDIPYDWGYPASPDSNPDHVWASLVLNFIDVAPLHVEPVFCTTSKTR